MTIKEKVFAAVATLKEIKTHFELTKWAKENGMDNRSAFSRFKKALALIDIDYDALKQIASKDKIEKKTRVVGEKLKDGKKITLYSDAKASNDRYAICDQSGEVVWAGRFFQEHIEQSACEMAAAKKAVWLAKKIREQNNLETIVLNLKVDAQWLTYAENVQYGSTRHGGKALQLGHLAEKYNVVLKMNWIPGKENPADKFTVCKGFEHFSNHLHQIKIK